MTDAPIRHFLIVYDIDRQEPTVEDFGTDDDAAIRAYEAREREHQFDSRIEVVLLSSDSLETIKRTHSSYFMATGERPLEAEIERLLARRPANNS